MKNLTVLETKPEQRRKMTKPAVSLANFAAARDRRNRLLLLPRDIRLQVNEGIRNGVGRYMISNWLKSIGHSITPSQVRIYIDAKYHEREV